MKTIYHIASYWVSLSLLCWLLSACEEPKSEPVIKPDEVIYDTGTISEDTPSDELLDLIDSLPSVEVDPSEVILPNGMSLEDFNKQFPPKTPGGRTGKTQEDIKGVQYRKNDIIRLMHNEGFRLIKRGDFTDLTGRDESTPANPYRPAQPNGIAYGLGNKNYEERKKPTEGLCFEEVYGLDCSGFVSLG